METMEMAPALRERLGHEAAVGLLDLLTTTKQEWTVEMIDKVTERSERRLVEETSKLRIEMNHGFSSLRQEMAAGFAQLRAEMSQGAAALRQEMQVGAATLRQEMAEQRFELLKWAFLFWVGQCFAIVSLMAIFLRITGRS